MAEFFNAASAREMVDWVNAQPARDSWTATQWVGVTNALGADLDGALKEIERLRVGIREAIEAGEWGGYAGMTSSLRDLAGGDSDG